MTTQSALSSQETFTVPVTVTNHFKTDLYVSFFHHNGEATIQLPAGKTHALFLSTHSSFEWRIRDPDRDFSDFHSLTSSAEPVLTLLKRKVRESEVFPDLELDDPNHTVCKFFSISLELAQTSNPHSNSKDPQLTFQTRIISHLPTAKWGSQTSLCVSSVKTD